MRRPATLERMEQRTELLTKTFDDCVRYFSSSNQFSGPSVYFHRRTIEMRQSAAPSECVADVRFLELLYATLTSWGMHRLGPGNTKLVDFDTFSAVVAAQIDNIEALEHLKLCDIADDELPELTRRLWEIIANLRVGVGETRIVSGSKTLHHILPDLIPPIDRQYTLRFFYDNTMINGGDARVFREIFPLLRRISCESRDLIRGAVGKSPMGTSEAKIVDNAIVGFCLIHLRKRDEQSRPGDIARDDEVSPA